MVKFLYELPVAHEMFTLEIMQCEWLPYLSNTHNLHLLIESSILGTHTHVEIDILYV